MSVRMALAKLSACAAGCAVVGVCAVHVAEPAAAKTEYRKVKQIKQAKPVKRVVRQALRKTKRIRRVTQKAPCCEPEVAVAAAVPQYVPPLPP